MICPARPGTAAPRVGPEPGSGSPRTDRLGPGGVAGLADLKRGGRWGRAGAFGSLFGGCYSD